jgi:hypothetical protein
MVAESTPRSEPARRARGGVARRVLPFAFGGLAVLLSATMLVSGAKIAWIDKTARDDAGYLNSSSGQFLTNSFALTSDPFDVHIGNYRKWISDEDAFGRIRLQAESADPDIGVFVGIGPTSDVERYLADVELDRVSGLFEDPLPPTYVRRAGDRAPALPAARSFWVESASGRGEQTVTWRAKSGRWTVVAMNADGSKGVDIRARAGAELALLNWLGPVLLGAGALLFSTGAAMLFFGARGERTVAPASRVPRRRQGPRRRRR